MEEKVWDVNKAFPFILVAVAIVVCLVASMRSRRVCYSYYPVNEPIFMRPSGNGGLTVPKSKSFFADRPVRVMSGGRPGIGLGDTPAAYDVSTGEIGLGF